MRVIDMRARARSEKNFYEAIFFPLVLLGVFIFVFVYLNYNIYLSSIVIDEAPLANELYKIMHAP